MQIAAIVAIVVYLLARHAGAATGGGTGADGSGSGAGGGCGCGCGGGGGGGPSGGAAGGVVIPLQGISGDGAGDVGGGAMMAGGSGTGSGTASAGSFTPQAPAGAIRKTPCRVCWAEGSLGYPMCDAKTIMPDGRVYQAQFHPGYDVVYPCSVLFPNR